MADDEGMQLAMSEGDGGDAQPELLEDVTMQSEDAAAAVADRLDEINRKLDSIAATLSAVQSVSTVKEDDASA